ncbi:MAG TPA: hypothetical protein VGI06_00130 [Acidimicrobiales bacterium]
MLAALAAPLVVAILAALLGAAAALERWVGAVEPPAEQVVTRAGPRAAGGA